MCRQLGDIGALEGRVRSHGAIIPNIGSSWPAGQAAGEMPAGDNGRMSMETPGTGYQLGSDAAELERLNRQGTILAPATT
jgi:hypothetical protein